MNAPTRDHVNPRSRGFTLKGNKLWCCAPCNRHKSNRTLTEWLEVLERKPGIHRIRIGLVRILIQQGRHLPPIDSSAETDV